MMVQVVVSSPKAAKRWNSKHKDTFRIQKIQDATQARKRIGEMFENIKQKNQGISFDWLEGLQRADMDSVLPTIVGTHKLEIILNSLHIAELTQTIEKQSVATTDVKDRTPISIRSELLKCR